jgi:single-strand DNA-binding protein
MNKVILIGNLTKDPEITTTANGVSVCRFTLAISRRYTNSEGERDADFINIVVWRALAENAHKFLRKGSKAAVVGNLQTRSYDAQDGSKRYVTEVVAEEVEFISTKTFDGEQTSRKEELDVTKLEPVDDSDLPF